MLPPAVCPRCRTLLVVPSEATPGKQIMCLNCFHACVTPSLADQLDDRQGMMRMGDDDGGGGDWGGGGDDDSEDEDEEDDEEEGEDGKKKKKKKKGLVDKAKSAIWKKLVGCVVGIAVLGCVICVVAIGSMTGLIKPSPAFVGEWESVSKVKVKAIDDDGKEIDDEVLEAKLEIKGSGEEGTGIYTDKEGTPYSFGWKVPDKDKKAIVFTFDTDAAKDKTFWKEIKSPATFDYKAEGSSLTLIPSAEATKELAFTKVAKAAPPPTKKKGKKK